MAPKAEDTAVRRQGFAGAACRDARNVGRGFEAGKVGGISDGEVVAGCAWESRNVFERDAVAGVAPMSFDGNSMLNENRMLNSGYRNSRSM